MRKLKLISDHPKEEEETILESHIIPIDIKGGQIVNKIDNRFIGCTRAAGSFINKAIWLNGIHNWELIKDEVGFGGEICLICKMKDK